MDKMPRPLCLWIKASSLKVFPQIEYPPYPVPSVQSPPQAIKPGMTRWKMLPLQVIGTPEGVLPISPVQRALKFSEVFGVYLLKAMTSLPTLVPPMLMSKKTLGKPSLFFFFYFLAGFFSTFFSYSSSSSSSYSSSSYSSSSSTSSAFSTSCFLTFSAAFLTTSGFDDLILITFWSLSSSLDSASASSATASSTSAAASSLTASFSASASATIASLAFSPSSSSITSSLTAFLIAASFAAFSAS